MNKEDRQYFALMNGIDLEKNGQINEAIKIYEKLAKESFDGSHIYDRLSILYRKDNDYVNEKRVLLKAIYVFTNIVDTQRGDRLPKLEKYKKRLEKLEIINSKKKITVLT